MSWSSNMTDFNEKDGWDRLMALNVKGVFYLTVALLPLLSNGATNIDPGRVINNSSIASVSPTADVSGTFSYNTSKAALNQLTRIMAVSLAEHKVTVNAIAPGIFPSRMNKYGRIGNTEDIAGLILFLCSRASAHITGAVIPMDGGQTVSNGKAARL
ncbi:hypothetical protein HK405_014279 [Cladochytrium tenue]|nr:hypothetical protein HK405_014279 [Cladochytrium tenue]